MPVALRHLGSRLGKWQKNCNPHRSMVRRVLAAASPLLLSIACNLPRDASGTLDRARAGSMRVGAIVNAPWVVDEGGLLRGPEPLFVENLARDLGARVQWVRGPEATLLKALHERELDLVIGGLTDDSPWQTEVALTRPYASKDKDHFVIAASPGENAWLVHVERALEHQRPSMQAALQGEGP